MAFTLIDAAVLWDNLKQGGQTRSVSKLAMDLETYQTHEELQGKLREIFKLADVSYPETSHVIHLRTTLLSALSRMEAQAGREQGCSSC
ncbi:hypothetical protein [Sporomusa malonica]|uniref:Uncharacterized protein n=1 Tax=Sporomusa malonica TaxID=112901 RepID=A0A1W1YN24_9FIRM|nr:hypothetical protein [Sporomusa malonica]SMC37577.1 hypothetical protein SAMN04488500_10218 [Sporomusa malonica]